MSAKPSPEEQAAQPEEQKPEAAQDNQPQAGANESSSAAADGPEADQQLQNAGTEAAAAADPAEAAGADTPSPDTRVAELEAQIADLTDRLLRAHAEMDNIRKRAEREKADTAKYAVTKFAGDIVLLADNFQRAISAVPAGAAEQDSTLKGLVEGVAMMEREFLNVLERHGVKRIDAQGQPFNPHLHDAVMEQQNPDVPTGTIVQVFQQGYTIEDRVLRPSMVVVAKGGPKQQPAEKPAEQQAQATAPETENVQQDTGPAGNGAEFSGDDGGQPQS